MVRLFIGDEEAELTEDFSVSITKAFDDLQNPTLIKNDYSKTITIPFTKANNKIFGYLYNLDRMITVDDEPSDTGLDFNPYKKINFRLEWNNSVLMLGYLKVLQITEKGYECSLNGELGNVFQELKKLTFDEKKYEGEEKEKYWIDTKPYYNQQINKDYIKSIWEGDTIPDAGFLADISYKDGFEYNTVQTDAKTSFTFDNYLEENTKFKKNTGIDAKTVVDKLNPSQIREFRSYLQQPYVKVKKLFEILSDKISTVANGWKISLDSGWFKETNPYWSNLSVLGGVFQKEEKLQIDDFVVSNPLRNISTLSGGINFSSIAKLSSSNVNVKDNVISTNNYHSFQMSGTLHLTWDVSLNPTAYSGLSFYFNESTAHYHYFDITISIKEQFGESASSYTFRIIPQGIYDLIAKGKYKINSPYPYYPMGAATSSSESNRFIAMGVAGVNFFRSVTDIPFKFSGTFLQSKQYTVNLKLDWGVEGQPEGYFWTKKIDEDQWRISNSIYSDLTVSNPKNQSSNLLLTTQIRSGNYLQLSDLFSKSFSLWDSVLNYCKMFNLKFITDYNTKLIIIKQSSDYFSDYKIVDWTDKVLKNNGYTIKPVVFENKYMKMNYEDSKSELNDHYKQELNSNYGEIAINTNYQFNTETKNLFSGIKTPVISSPVELFWQDLIQNKIFYYLPAENYINNMNNDGKNVDMQGAFVFVKQQDFDPELYKKTKNVKAIVTDDTELQRQQNLYFYSSEVNSVPVTKYLTGSFVEKYVIPHSAVRQCLLYFGTPKYIYTYDEYKPKSNSGEDIYSLVWRSYLNERYNLQNKIWTVYLNIKPMDFMNFDFNTFVKIGEQLYFVNKIYDYDITSNQPTKVDLLTISNIKGYTK